MDWISKLICYVPQTAQEEADKTEMLQAAIQYGSATLERTSPSGGHFCCSGMILDETMTKVLLVYHNIYQSFSWTGGHADGESDFLAVAIREAQRKLVCSRCSRFVVRFCRWMYCRSRHIRNMVYQLQPMFITVCHLVYWLTRNSRCILSRMRTVQYAGNQFLNWQRSVRSHRCCQFMKN